MLQNIKQKVTKILISTAVFSLLLVPSLVSLSAQSATECKLLWEKKCIECFSPGSSCNLLEELAVKDKCQKCYGPAGYPAAVTPPAPPGAWLR